MSALYCWANTRLSLLLQVGEYNADLTVDDLLHDAGQQPVRRDLHRAALKEAAALEGQHGRQVVEREHLELIL
jgi:hypothetical protein